MLRDMILEHGECRQSYGIDRAYHSPRSGRPMRRLIPILVLGAAAAAQEFVTLEQASSRSGRDMTPAYEGRAITIRGQVSAPPVWALGTYYLPVRDVTDHGMLIRGDRERFADLQPGD